MVILLNPVFIFCQTPGHLIAECSKLKVKKASQSRNQAIPESAI